MTGRPFSEAFKQKMVDRLIGKNAVSAMQLARETGISQQNLSRWLDNARKVPTMARDRAPSKPSRTVADKVSILAGAEGLDGDQLSTYLERKGVSLAELEQWRRALDDGATPTTVSTRRIRKLERELARKDKALAEAAALLILKKKVEELFGEDEDDDTDEEKGT